jgi:ubiquinone biosynthesis protein
MEVQPQLVLLQKTLFNIEGIGRRLYPELDLWETAKPFLESWSRTQFGPEALFKALKRELPRWWRILPETPAVAYDLLRQAGQGELSLHWHSTELGRLRAEMRTHHRRLLLTGSGLLVSAAVVLAVSGTSLTAWASGAVWLFGGAGLALIAAAWPRQRS